MTRRNGGRLNFGQLKEAARHVYGVHPGDFSPNDGGYEALREAMDDHIRECKWCDAEYVNGWSTGFCTDQCEVDYIHEFYPEEA